MQSFETVVVDNKSVSCNGGSALGHPLVYLNMGPAHKIECPYCSRLFVLDGHVSGDLDEDSEHPVGADPH